jgi:PEP-CTERM motif
MKTFVKCCAALCAVAAILAIGSMASADPTGGNYAFTAINSPGGPLPGGASGLINWNNSGSPVTVAGTGLDVDEQVTLLGGGMELLEWSVKTTNGGGIIPFQADSTLPSAIFFTSIPEPAGTLTEPNTAFIYFTKNGVAQPMSDLAGLGLVFAPHPTNPAIQVLILGSPYDNNTLLSNGFGIDTNALSPGATLSLVLGALNLSGVAAQINDAHLGVTVNTVPEPGTAVLAALGLVGLIPLAVRRRVKR